MAYLRPDHGPAAKPDSTPRPKPRPRSSAKGAVNRPAPRPQQSKPQQPKKRDARQELAPDAATKRLLELSLDKQGNVKGGAFSLLTMGRSLAERQGKTGASTFLALANAGVPVASLGEKARSNASSYLKSLASAGVDIGHVPNVSILTPQERNQIRGTLKKNGTDPGAHASDAEILNSIKKHKPGLSDIISNAPKSAGKALVGLPEGAWGAGQVAGAAVFNRDLAPAKAAGKGLVDYYGHIKEHPLGALEQDPVGTVMALMPAKTVVGGFAGQAARAGALGNAARTFANADRKALELPKARLTNHPGEAPQVIPALDQGPLRANLIDRAAQVGLEKATAKSGALSRRRVNQLSSRRAAESKHAGYQTRNDMMQAVAGAKRKLTGVEKRAVTAYAQGITPRQMAEYYKLRLQDEPFSKHIKAQADLWDKVAQKVPAPNERITNYLDATRAAVGEREASLRRVTGIDEAKLQAREGITREEVLNRLKAADHPAATETAPTPFYFPHVGEPPQFRDFLYKRGMQPTRRINQQLKKNELALFKSGKWQPDPRHLDARIASAPLAEESLNHLQSQFKEFGRKVPPGTAYDPAHAKLVRVNPAGGKVVKHDLSGEGLAQQIRDVKASSATDKDFIEQLKHQLIKHTPDGRVPNDGVEYMVVPNEVMDQVTGTLKSMNRGGILRGLNSATDAWRYITLQLRGGYLVNNVVGNTLQSAVGGVGPVSIARAIRHGSNDLVPRKILGSGTTADMSQVQKLGGNADKLPGQILNAVAESKLGRGVSSAAGMNPIVRGNIAYENMLRRALYLRHAIPAAKTAANGSRFSRMSDEVMQHLQNNEIPQGTQKVVEFLGDMRKKNRANARLAMPFYRWIGFISKLSLATLPMKYPVRNELMQALGRMGNDELAKMGIMPEWLHGAIPVSTSQQNVDGQKHQFANLVGTQGLNPFASIEQTFGRGARGLVSSLNPIVTSGANVAFGRDLESGFDLRDANGKVIDISRAGEPEFWKAVMAQELRNLPLVNLISPASYHSADSPPLPFLEGPQHFPKGQRQPDMPTLNNVLAYFTGVRVRPTDLTLYNLQAAYKLLQDSSLSAEQKKTIRHRINVETGKAKRKGLKVTVPIQVPTINVPDIKVPDIKISGQ